MLGQRASWQTVWRFRRSTSWRTWWYEAGVARRTRNHSGRPRRPPAGTVGGRGEGPAVDQVADMVVRGGRRETDPQPLGTAFAATGGNSRRATELDQGFAHGWVVYPQSGSPGDPGERISHWSQRQAREGGAPVRASLPP